MADEIISKSTISEKYMEISSRFIGIYFTEMSMAVRPLPRRYHRGGGGAVAVDIFKNHRGSGAVAVDFFGGRCKNT